MQIVSLCVCIVCIWLNGLELSHAGNNNINQTYLVWYQREEHSIDTFRLLLKNLNRELNEGNSDFLSCGENASVCLKTGQCLNEALVQPEKASNGTDCWILVYQYLPAVSTSPNTATVIAPANTSNGKRSTGAPAEHHLVTDKPTPSQVWGCGVLAVGIISLSGLFGVVFWPLMKTDIYAQMMWVLIGLAVGSLTASATFQLIPEGFRLKEHDEDYLTTALFMWSSFWALYMFESLAKIIFHDEEENIQAVPSEDDSGVAMTLRVEKTMSGTEEQSNRDLDEDGLLQTVAIHSGNVLSPNTTSLPLYMSQGSLHNLTLKKSSHNHSHGKKRGGGGSNTKTATIAWMIIFGDGIHNFIDGMSIGAGFTQSIAMGASISIAIACEEFPHELGDFAILINSGMSVKRALLYNFLSACTSFAGLILGILLGEIDASVYIFAFAGGLFLYIALTDLMPELNEMIAGGLAKGKKSALYVLLLQNVGIFIGVTILYLVTRFPINIA